MENKKGWLDYLYYKVGKQNFDYYVSGTFEDNGERKFRKWKKYSEVIMPSDGSDLDWINQRQIFPNEIVLDIEDPFDLPLIIDKLKEWGWKGKGYSTGSRGYHIHIFTKENICKEEKEAILTRLKTDVQKCSDKNLIALENCPHWKTGRIKREIKWK